MIIKVSAPLLVSPSPPPRAAFHVSVVVVVVVVVCIVFVLISSSYRSNNCVLNITNLISNKNVPSR